MIDFHFLGAHFTNGFVIGLSIIFILGLFMGWFMRKGKVFWCLLTIIVFSPILESIAMRDDFFITLAFTLGFLVHTGKPIYRKIFS
jgi:hypothetical protein